MANLVEQIKDAIDAEVRTQTGLTTTDRLRKFFDIEQSDRRTIRNGYAVRPLAASTSDGVIKNYTLSQEFEVILTKAIPRQADDDDAQEAMYSMYDSADEILKAVLNSQLGIPTIILSATDPAISEFEILGDGQFAVLRIQFTVKYRTALNS